MSASRARSSQPREDVRASIAANRQRRLAVAQAMRAEAGLPEGWVNRHDAPDWARGEGVVHEPDSRTERLLMVTAHECGHVFLHLEGEPGARLAPHVQEMEAEAYAHQAMLVHGLAVPKWRTTFGRIHVAGAILRDEAQGLDIDPRAREYAEGQRSPFEPLRKVPQSWLADGRVPRPVPLTLVRRAEPEAASEVAAAKTFAGEAADVAAAEASALSAPAESVPGTTMVPAAAEPAVAQASAPPSLPPPRPLDRVNAVDRLAKAVRESVLLSSRLTLALGAMGLLLLHVWSRIASGPLPHAWLSPFLLALVPVLLAFTAHGRFLQQRIERARLSAVAGTPPARPARRWWPVTQSLVTVTYTFLLLFVVISLPSPTLPLREAFEQVVSVLWPIERFVAALAQGAFWAAIGLLLAEVLCLPTRGERRRMRRWREWQPPDQA